MLKYVLLFNLILCPLVICKRKHNKEEDFSVSVRDLGGKFLSDMRKDANLDLSADNEYEDLKGELVAYHTALASLTASRRSLKTTPCWKLGGVCVNYKLCQGHRYLSEVAGCRDKEQVCCFTWNNYQVRDMTDKGIGLLMPWSSPHREFGGLGVIDPPSAEKKKLKKKKNIKAMENAEIIVDHVKDKKEEHYKSRENPSLVVTLKHNKET